MTCGLFGIQSLKDVDRSAAKQSQNTGIRAASRGDAVARQTQTCMVHVEVFLGKLEYFGCQESILHMRSDGGCGGRGGQQGAFQKTKCTRRVIETIENTPLQNTEHRTCRVIRAESLLRNSLRYNEKTVTES